jgi:hypothetical protein
VANLELAADELVRKLKSVDEDVAGARETLTRLTGQVASLGEGLDEEWIAVAKAAADLVEKAGEELALLGREAQETAQAVAELEGTGRASQEAAEAGLAAAHDGTESLTQAVEQRGPQMDSAAEGGDQSLDALEKQAAEVAAALEQVGQQVRDFLTGDVVQSLEAMQVAIAERFEALRTTIAEEHPAALRQAYESWAERLEEVLGLVEEDGFAAMQIQGQQVVDWAFGELASEHGPELELLVDVAGMVDRTLGKLHAETVPASHDDVSGDEGARALAQAMAETGAALAGMITALEACRQTMAGYSFVQL